MTEPDAPQTKVAATLDVFPVTAHSEHAYRPRPGDRVTPGRNHAVLDVPLRFARFRRDTGDALCKPARMFWGLDRDPEPVNCETCLRRAVRYGVDIRPPCICGPDSTGEAPDARPDCPRDGIDAQPSDPDDGEAPF